MRSSIPFALVLFAFGCVVSHCKSPEQAGATASESAYTAALLRCVDDAKTLAESRSCRQLVDATWGVVEREAGAR